MNAVKAFCYVYVATFLCAGVDVGMAVEKS